MNSAPAISVLFPVYNTEKYLAEALDSLEAQTFRNFEIIAVNDGSTDRSGEILRDYAARFPNIRLIEQANSGKPAALNAGLDQASGEWIAIMDSDDSVAPEYLEHLYATAQENGADLVSCGYELIYPECRILRDSRWACTVPHSLAEFPELLFLDNTNWNKLYRMQMLKTYNIRFDRELKMAEDLPFFFQTLLAANRIAVTPHPLYFYRQEREGQLTAIDDARCFSVFRAFGDTNRFIEEHGFDYIRPWLLHSALSLFAYMYERAKPEFREEFFGKMNAYFHSIGCTPRTKIPSGPWRGASAPDKVRWGMLRILHPLSLRAILRNDRKAYDRLIAFRLFLLYLFRKLS